MSELLAAYSCKKKLKGIGAARRLRGDRGKQTTKHKHLGKQCAVALPRFTSSCSLPDVNQHMFTKSKALCYEDVDFWMLLVWTELGTALFRPAPPSEELIGGLLGHCNVHQTFSPRCKAQKDVMIATCQWCVHGRQHAPQSRLGISEGREDGGHTKLCPGPKCLRH